VTSVLEADAHRGFRAQVCGLVSGRSSAHCVGTAVLMTLILSAAVPIFVRSSAPGRYLRPRRFPRSLQRRSPRMGMIHGCWAGSQASTIYAGVSLAEFKCLVDAAGEEAPAERAGQGPVRCRDQAVGDPTVTSVPNQPLTIGASNRLLGFDIQRSHWCRPAESALGEFSRGPPLVGRDDPGGSPSRQTGLLAR
jgi:hypothetical protein